MSTTATIHTVGCDINTAVGGHHEHCGCSCHNTERQEMMGRISHIDLHNVIINFHYMSAYQALDELCRLVGIDAVRSALDDIQAMNDPISRDWNTPEEDKAWKNL